MKRAAMLAASAALAVLLAAEGPGAPAPPRLPSRREVLTKAINDAPKQLLKEKDPEERQRIYDRLEAAKHELGPCDFDSKRVHPKAMWRDRALDLLEAEVKRFEPPAGGSAPSPSAEAKYQVRRMALECLKRGWAHGGDLPKYQYDALAQYVVNNLKTLDALLETVDAWAAREALLAADDPNREAFTAAVKRARDGIPLFDKAYLQLTTTEIKTYRDRDKIVASLGIFVDGLAAVDEANGTLEDLAGRREKPQTSDATAPADLLPLAPEDQEQLAKVRQVAAALGGQDWAKVRTYLEAFAAMAEKGLQVPRTQAQARDLLRCVRMAAVYVDRLVRSRAVYPEFVESHRRSLEYALREVEDKRSRERGYSSIRRTYEGRGTWRVLDESPLGPEAALGYMKAYAVGSERFGSGTAAGSNYYAFREALDTSIRVLDAMAGWKPEAMHVRLRTVYDRAKARFLEAAAAAGKAEDRVFEPWRQKHVAAGTAARDLELVVQADQAVRLTGEYLPNRAVAMAAECVNALGRLMGPASKEQAQARRDFELFVRPFGALAQMEKPDPKHAALAMRISGGAYNLALGRFRQQAGQAIEKALTGNTYDLDPALEPVWMFRLLNHRCALETRGLDRAPLEDLDAFSMPAAEWRRFLESLDATLRNLFVQFASDRRGFGPDARFLRGWEQVYCAIASAQEQALRVRPAGVSEREILLGNLQKVADPTPPDTVWFGWAVGYHMTEAAVSYVGGYPGTAGFHRGELDMVRRRLHFEDAFTWSDLAPPPPAPPAKPGRAAGGSPP